ncbi:MAG: threonylcarbamoyl-AMP synthase [Planctomycetes bacterium GWF2_41_51]|nr:MAG: threonylcarbamoyl-AMP synthase [Planctomycetes bacterium GWF2_41_51]HBG27090.1 threonylcarbamoyl-AMP synthase [Phycisphaerales bacterium]
MAAEIIEVKDPIRDIEKLKKCAECIDSGGLVVFPTETVYGIACRAEKKSIERLDEVKQRNIEKRYTLHIGDKNKLSDFVPNLTPPVKKLVRNAWPGPLTIVFEIGANDIEKLKEKHGGETVELLYKDSSIGVRCPDEPVAETLLNLCKYPVVAPSANTAGQPPATEGRQAYEQIGDFVDIVIDSGTCKFEKSSTVVKISPSGLGILRVGAFSERQIRKMYKLNILFVCSGNTCRSPIAEAMAKKFLAEKFGCNIDQLEDMGYKIESAGVLAMNGIAASDGSVMFCESRGADLSKHKSQRLTVEKIKSADYIFAMSNGHKDAIMQLCSQAERKCMLLKEDAEIDDPIGGDYEAYKFCGEIIEKAVNDRMSGLFK